MSQPILVPALGPASSRDLLTFAACLLPEYGGLGTVLSVVELPEERSLSEGALVVRRRRRLLQKVSQLHGTQSFQADVRIARTTEEGIREAVADTAAGLLVLPWRRRGLKLGSGALEHLLSDPPCDVAVVKTGQVHAIQTVLVPARGGPQARLALRLAEAVAEQREAVLTLLHITLPHWSAHRRAREEQHFRAILKQVRYANVQELEIESESIEAGLLSEGARHDLVVMGAAGRDERSAYALGAIPEAAARTLACSVVIVKTREPVTAATFLEPRPGAEAGEESISDLVDRWFAQNTFHSHEFRNLAHLVDLKERQGLTISLALPTLNEEKTVGKIISTTKRELMERVPLLDELIVIDSESDDRTVEIATSLGVPVHKHPDVLAQHGTLRGKGEALWKSLYLTSGDIVAWIDSDITGFHPKFVYGLLGPLLTQPRLGFVKGFYRRPLKLGSHLLTTGGGRVTELTARPLINLFYPQLSGLVQPLAGEMAGRRSVLESVPFFTGYGVETGLLIDILDQFGLRSIAQSDLEYRVHRNQTLFSLSNMAFAIVQVVIKRLGDRKRLQLLEEVNTSMKLIHYSPNELFLEVKKIDETERPPIKTIPEYAVRSRGRTGVRVDGV